MKKLLSFILFQLGLVSLAIGQSYVPPSPDASGLSKFANIPVNYYTGTPGINIPLTELHGKILSVPVSLSYDASGFRVQDVAGSTGLGWTLNAGGVITRVVRGLPDEDVNGYCGTNGVGEKATSNPGSSYLDNVDQGNWDGEPDLFYFNFLGHTGKFVLDANGTPFTIPYEDIYIKPGICISGSGEWQIVDENGIIYKFGSTSASRETTTYRPANLPPGNEKSYISSWYLTEVDDPNNSDQITFTYTSSTINYQTYYYTENEYENPCDNYVNALTDRGQILSVNTRYVQSIASSLGTVSFIWKFGREDLDGGMYLESLTVQNPDVIHKNRFEYSYFHPSNCTTQLCKRLRLDKIYDLAPDPIASFTYNTSVNLPSRDSYNFDHWGYYNNNTVNSPLPAFSQPSTWCTSGSQSFSGATRDPDATKTLANILTRIDYRTGAYQSFTMGANRARVHVNDATDVVIGGARIQSITTGDGNGNTVTRNFSYSTAANPNLSSGLLYYLPAYYAYQIHGGVWRRYSQSLVDAFDLNGAHIGYSRVVESISGLGKSVYLFTNFDAYQDGTGVFDYCFSPLMIPQTSVAWERGNLLEVQQYDEQGNILLHQVNKYSNALPIKRSIKAWVTVSNNDNCNTNLDYVSGNYSLISRPFTMRKRIVETYQPGTSNKIIQVQNFGYDPNTYQLVSTTSYDSLRPTITYSQETRFVTNSDYDDVVSSGVDCQQQSETCQSGCDNETDPSTRAACYQGCYATYQSCLLNQSNSSYSESAAILALKNRHEIGAPVELISKYTNGSSVTVLSSSVNIYQVEGSSNNHVDLKETWNVDRPIPEANFSYSKANSNTSFSKDVTLRQVHTYDTYSASTDNLTKETDLSGISTSYQWGNNNSIVTGETVNPTITPRTTSYTFEPLVGQLTETDPNGITSTSEYDAYNRIKDVKDNNGNIVSSYRYNYANETPGFRISADNTEALNGTLIHFSVVDIAASSGGTPTFAWDFDDGTVDESGNTSVSHTFPATGTYTVKLVGMNPSYGAATRAQDIVIYSVLGATMCADGPTHVDLCNDFAYYGSCTPGNEQNQPYGPTTFTVAPTNGCPTSTYTYSWQEKEANDVNWTPLGSNPSATFTMPGGNGNWTIKCTITDACGNTTTPSTSVDHHTTQCN